MHIITFGARFCIYENKQGHDSALEIEMIFYDMIVS